MILKHFQRSFCWHNQVNMSYTIKQCVPAYKSLIFCQNTKIYVFRNTQKKDKSSIHIENVFYVPEYTLMFSKFHQICIPEYNIRYFWNTTLQSFTKLLRFVSQNHVCGNTHVYNVFFSLELTLYPYLDSTTSLRLGWELLPS